MWTVLLYLLYFYVNKNKEETSSYFFNVKSHGVKNVDEGTVMSRDRTRIEKLVLTADRYGHCIIPSVLL